MQTAVGALRCRAELPEFNDYQYIAKVARVNAAAPASLGLEPAAPPKAQLPTDKLENNSVLRWEANSEPDLAG